MNKVYELQRQRNSDHEWEKVERGSEDGMKAIMASLINEFTYPPERLRIVPFMERDRTPIRIHKGLVLRGLKGPDKREWLECIELDEGTTVLGFIAEMEASPHDWFIDGVLAPDDRGEQ